MNFTNNLSLQILKAKLASWYENFRRSDQIFMILLALIIGVLGGFGAVGIRLLIELFSEVSFPGSSTLLNNIRNTPWYQILLVPALGGLIVGPLIHFFAKEAKGHGVPEVMQAILLKGGVIRKRVAFIKALASSISIGTGGSVGREGPIVQIGASIGSTIGQLFNVPGKRIKTLVGCGAAAGIAAAFNAPIAGALFAVEIILMDFGFTQFSPIVISSVMATVISHHFEGNFAAFQVPQYQTTSAYELILYALLGILSGLISFLFIKILYFSEDTVDKIKFPEYLKPAIGGLLIGATALIFPEIMGVGYNSINDALHGRIVGFLAFYLIFIKIFATSLTLSSGGSGGIFAPSLFIGAMLGAVFGDLANQIFPNIHLHAGAYALVAMGGLVAGTTRGPITAIIMIFELTNDYRIILPLMITGIISTVISSKLSSESIYTLKLLLRNINIRGGTDVNILRNIFVKDLYNKNYNTIPYNAPFKEVVNQLITATTPYLFVIRPKEEFVGLITLQNVKKYLFDRDTLSHILIAEELADQDIEMVLPTDHGQIVMEKLTRSHYNCLPVRDPKKSNSMIGIICRKEINNAYNQEVERQELVENLANKITLNQKQKMFNSLKVMLFQKLEHLKNL